jgi:hypothetical protein
MIPNILISGKIIKEMLGSVASGTQSINTATVIVTLCRWQFGAKVARELSQPVHQTARVTIPDAVLKKFNLLMTSMLLLETCRGM